ncbi:MAG: BlaI/MecI/CopY family transcriptional regulator, partial [Bacteroidales bacterium]|nr:BlaI/MecI/CopY family transcriptional regulator [Bacteroidales bacterium]
MKKLTRKEEEIMNLFWDKGAMFVRELQALYDDPKPHFNTLSTMVRTLESNGYVA